MFLIILTAVVICIIEWLGDRSAVRRALEADRIKWRQGGDLASKPKEY
jgi:hypothetical protein